MPKKCEHCGALFEKHHEVQINGVKRYFCPKKYSPLAPDCITKYLKNNREEIYQFCVISFVS